METDRIRRWIKIIAAFFLLSTLAGICFYILTKSGVIDEAYTELEVFHFYISTLMGLVICLGLWRLEPWGWKSAILFIPLSWILYLFELFVDYEQGLGLLTAPFALVDALILNYLYKPKVCRLFRIFTSPLLQLQWLVKALFVLALFLAVMDIFGEIFGFITIIAVFFGLETARKTMKKLKRTKDPTSH